MGTKKGRKKQKTWSEKQNKTKTPEPKQQQVFYRDELLQLLHVETGNV